MRQTWTNHLPTGVGFSCIHEYVAIYRLKYEIWFNIIPAATCCNCQWYRQGRDPPSTIQVWNAPPGVFEEGWARTAEPEPDSSQYLHVTGLLQGIEDRFGSCLTWEWYMGCMSWASWEIQDWPRPQENQIPWKSEEKSLLKAEGVCF